MTHRVRYRVCTAGSGCTRRGSLTRSPSSLGPVPVFEVTMRGLLLVADSPAALTGALASVLRARPAARGVDPYRTLGEVTSGRAEALVYGLEMVEPHGRARECRNSRYEVIRARV